MTIQADYHLKLLVKETLALGLDNAPDPVVTHQIGSLSGTLEAGSTVPATKAWSDQRQLTAGSDSIDLTALVGALSSAIDLTGLKVQLVLIKAAAANTAAIVVADGSANGYQLFGDASGQVTLPAGAAILLYVPDLLADVAAGAKTIDVTSSDTDAIYDIIIVAG